MFINNIILSIIMNLRCKVFLLRNRKGVALLNSVPTLLFSNLLISVLTKSHTLNLYP